MKPAILTILAVLLSAWPAVRPAQAAQADIEAYLKANAVSLNRPADLDPLLERVGDARIVLLGESSHGTSEYYQWRAEISKRLIEEKGFDFILVEGDWPSCYQVNRYVQQLPDAPEDAEAALAAFQRWPRWMWGNEETAKLVEWMAEHNADRPADERAGFFGMDVYSLAESMDAVIAYAREQAPDLADEIAEAYQCLMRFRDDPREYARHTLTGQNCARQTRAVVALLTDNAERLRERDRRAYFDARQNAAVVKGAELHYRAMTQRGAASWNRRVEHMKATLNRLLDEHGPESRGIVWAHNTHIGDARATPMADGGMKNIGWLARLRYEPEEVVAVGFATHRGKVLAGRQWEAPVETMTVPPAQAGSIEDIFNRLDLERAMIIFGDDVPDALQSHLGHRAKGVVYNPEADRRNYVPTVLPRRYDAFIFIAETSELNALDD